MIHAYTLVNELVNKIIVAINTSVISNNSSAFGPVCVEFLNAKYVANNEAKSTVSPQEKAKIL